jgi:hypothetical protein
MAHPHRMEISVGASIWLRDCSAVRKDVRADEAASRVQYCNGQYSFPWILSPAK